jgi:hypothetical protein
MDGSKIGVEAYKGRESMSLTLLTSLLTLSPYETDLRPTTKDGFDRSEDRDKLLFMTRQKRILNQCHPLVHLAGEGVLGK